MATGKRTTDHETIKQWIEQRGGHPAVVASTMEDDGGGILRVDFPGYSGEASLQQIGWEEFFEVFEDRELAFVYQEQTEDGSESRFSKFVSRSSED